MARFFFDTHEGHVCCWDSEGLDLPDEASARRMGWTCLGEVLADLVKPPEAPVVIVVSDRRKQPLYEVRAIAGPPAE